MDLNELKILRFLAFCSNIAYDDDYDHLKRILRRMGYSLKFYECNGTECFMAVKDDYAIVSFRGTQVVSHFSLIDIVHNLMLTSIDIKNIGTLHKGYYSCAVDILYLLKPDLDKLNGKNIIFTGHSMGAAIAHICALLLKNDRITTVGFGLPKYIIPNQNFEKFYYVLLFEDMMTRTFWLGYEKIGKMIFIDNLRNITDEIKFDGTFFNKIKAYLKMFTQNPYTNHDIQKYEIAIKQVIAKKS